MAIRSALVHGDSVRLYAGAGLVAGSVARHELDETQAKMRTLPPTLTLTLTLTLTPTLTLSLTLSLTLTPNPNP